MCWLVLAGVKMEPHRIGTIWPQTDSFQRLTAALILATNCEDQIANYRRELWGVWPENQKIRKRKDLKRVVRVPCPSIAIVVVHSLKIHPQTGRVIIHNLCSSWLCRLWAVVKCQGKITENYMCWLTIGCTCNKTTFYDTLTRLRVCFFYDLVSESQPLGVNFTWPVPLKWPWNSLRQIPFGVAINLFHFPEMSGHPSNNNTMFGCGWVVEFLSNLRVACCLNLTNSR